MKYYEYISTAKLDMLIPQIPEKDRVTVAAELGFNLGVINGKIGTSREQSHTREADSMRCAVLQRFLESKDYLGDLGSGDLWIHGTYMARCLILKYQILLCIGDLLPHDNVNTLVLSGSTAHVIGQHGTVEDPRYLPSYGPFILGCLRDLVETPEILTDHPDDIEHPVIRCVGGGQADSWASAVNSFKTVKGSPATRIEVLARQLFPVRSYRNQTYGLYSPVYIASA